MSLYSAKFDLFPSFVYDLPSSMKVPIFFNRLGVCEPDFCKLSKQQYLNSLVDLIFHINERYGIIEPRRINPISISRNPDILSDFLLTACCMHETWKKHAPTKCNTLTRSPEFDHEDFEQMSKQV